MKHKLLFTLWLLCITMTLHAQLPTILLKSTSGQLVRTDSLVGRGETTVVCFFATWCKPCLRELKALHEVYDDWQAEKPFRFVAISIDEAQNSHKVQGMAVQEGWKFEVLLDETSEFKRQLQVQSIPQAFVFDAQGTLRYRHSGYTEGDEEELWQKIRQISTTK